MRATLAEKLGVEVGPSVILSTCNHETHCGPDDPGSSALRSTPHLRRNWPRPLPPRNPSRYLTLCGAKTATFGARSMSSSTATASSPKTTSAGSPTLGSGI